MEIKFISSSTELLGHLQTISRVIKTKNTLPVLDCFLFDINGKTMKVVASDMETTMETTMQLETVTGKGRFALSARMLLDTLREFPEQPLTFVVDTETMGVKITSSNGKFSIVGQRADTYPQCPTIQETHGTLNISVEHLRSGINKTYFATAEDELRPTLGGIFFEVKSEGTTFVASDSHKLVQMENRNIKSEIETDFILSKKPATMVLNILSKEHGENIVNIKFDEKNVFFELGKFKIICRLVEGKYPNYRAIIPKDNTKLMTIDRLSFMNTLKRVNVFSNQASNLVRFALKDNTITISAQDIDFSTSAQETLPCQYNDTELTIGFKSLFLLDMLQYIEHPEVTIAFGDFSRSVLIYPFEQKENENLQMLLAPLNLNE